MSSNGHDPYQALRFRDYRLFLSGSLIAGLGGRMLALAIGWEIYERTDSALALGVVGLVQIAPVLLLSLATGHVADQYNRKTVIVVSQGLVILTSLGLAALAYWQGSLLAIYACLLLRGIGAAFSSPATTAISAAVVPEEAFENSASWNTSFGQVAAVAGPALGGLLIAALHGTALVYLLSALGSLIFVVSLIYVRGTGAALSPRSADDVVDRPTLRAMGEGIAFLRRTPVILAAITLDLFAVLFGGVVTLLPIFARDILQVGPSGLGWLNAASSVGAVLVGLTLAHRPPLQRAGPTLLLAVAGFGLATIFFGLSRSYWFSLLMLAVLGGLDCVSMIVRDTLMLTRFPHEMRGRVAAIEGVFISSSNQLGGFESGLTAQLFGPIVSVVGGGVGTIVVVLIVTVLSPELRNLGAMRQTAPVVVSEATSS